MKIASIDIGTNAIKSKIFVTTPTSIELIKAIRSPIRLGGDVFQNGILSKRKLNQVIKTVQEYEGIFKQEAIEHYEIVATSAFRDTSNSEDARRYIENAIHHPVRVISGLEEAKLMRFHPQSMEGNSSIFVDLGGGSTEFFIHDQDGIQIRSFQLGAVRNMLKKDSKREWIRLKKWLQATKPKKHLIAIGGNMKSFLQWCEIQEIGMIDFDYQVARLKALTTKEKIKLHKFSPDRADVIDYALEIFKFITDNLDVKKISATKWGVSDSIAVKTFHELYSKKIKIS